MSTEIESLRILPGRTDLTWVGPHADPNLLSFGTENGEIFFTDLAGRIVSDVVTAIPEGAINGIAFLKNSFVVCSPAGSVIGETTPDNQYFLVGEDHINAHALTLGQHENIFISLGIQGFSCITNNSNEIQRFVSDDPVYMYSLASICDYGDSEFLIAAMRTAGIGIINWEPGSSPQLNSFNAKSSDCIDVISPCNKFYPNSAFALLKNCELAYFEDVRLMQSPKVLQLNAKGVAYKILCSDKITVVLTSHELFICTLFDNAGALNHEGTDSKFLSVPIEAIDMNLVGDRWLLVIMNDHVKRFDLQELRQRLITSPGSQSFVAVSQKTWSTAEYTMANDLIMTT